MHLLEHLRIAGNGITDAVVDLAISQRSEGRDVLVMSSPGGYEELLARRGISFVNLHTARKPIVRWVGGVWRARRVLRSFAPDVIHAHTPTSYIQARLSGQSAPFVATAHTQFSPSTRLFAGADALIAVSESDGNALRDWFPSRKLHVVRNGVIGSQRVRLSSPTRPRASGASVSLLYGGGLNRRKGVDILLTAFAQMEATGVDATLTIVGDGPEREKLQKLAAELGLKRVSFLGFRSDLPDVMADHDIFVVPSRREPFGLVAAQARAVGLCIVASQVEGLTEVLEGGRAGVLVEPDNVEALAAALTDLASSPSLRAAYAHRAADNLEWLSVDRNRVDVDRVYQSLVSQHPKGG
ncbi:glycosyltransferase [Microbacterium testaceum]|uniref:glycosyltransferase n=1 Tax=Microbacterium testaceum TaxID=2033 RepID=UPI0022E9416C|nr:glycosyltransferase [Microbacterium testaceum]